MKLGQFCIAEINGKQVSLTNSLYQIYKSNQQPFTVDGIEYTSIKKHSTSLQSKAVKTRWFSYEDGTSIEVVEGSEYTPHKDIQSIAYRSVKTWFEITNEEN